MGDSPPYDEARALLDLECREKPRVLVTSEEIDAHGDLPERTAIDPRFLDSHYAAQKAEATL